MSCHLLPGLLRAAPLAVLLLIPACGDPAAPAADAGPPPIDALVADARPDAEPPDAAPPDAAPDPDATCAVELPCPAASPNKVSMCGRLVDVVTSEVIAAAAPTRLACGALGAATDGPCALELAFYDALDFAGNPTGAVPLPIEELVVDDCGRFRAHNINRPALGFFGVAVDDADGADDLHRLTGTAVAASSAQVIVGHQAYVVTRAADQTWSTQAGLVGDSFADRGAVFAVYLHGATPVAGVGMTSDGAPRPADTFYFSDTDPAQHTTIDPEQTATGASGAALMLGSSLVEHSGAGGEPAGCQWESSLAASIPGVLFTKIFQLQGGGPDGACP